jgi:phosphoribosylanthranilate isomerase
MTAVKICGLTREEDVEAAAELGAEILGFNFVTSSPRRISVSRARALAAAAPVDILRAGVFTTEDRREIARTVGEVPLQVVQLHRRVTPEDVEALPAAVMPAVRIEEGRAGLPPADILARCRSVLWDSSAGMGRAPDWSLIEDAAALPVPVFVAGGLDPENVGEVIRRLRPSGVDVASGIESAPGIKDRRKLERFFAAVREADRDAG